MKKIAYKKILLAMGLSVFMNAHADTIQPIHTMTANATLTVSEPLQPLTFDVTPVPGVSSPAMQEVVATGKISTPTLLAGGQSYALRWSPANGVLNGLNSKQITYQGSSNSANSIIVEFRFKDALEGSALPNGWVTGASIGNTPKNELNFEVVNMKLNVSPDTYRMYMDAGIYTI